MRFLAFLAAALIGTSAQAAAVYSDWGDNAVGNYQLTIAQQGVGFDVEVTVVDPWNAEVLGLFVDLGNVDVGVATLSNVDPSGEVAVFATDTVSESCGQGCNLNGNGNNTLPAVPDGQWEFVIRLGAQGFDGIQTFSFHIESSEITLTESMLGIVGIRAQQLCSGDDTLPDDEESCDGSEKVVGLPDFTTNPPSEIPLPGSLALLGIGLVGLALRARRI